MVRLALMIYLFYLFAVCPAMAVAGSGQAKPTTLQKRATRNPTLVQARHAKLDGDIDPEGKEKLPIFVRFEDQMFQSGGDYRIFVEKHRHDKRSRLRLMVLSKLREASNRTWQRVAHHIQKLEKEGRLSHLQRYWIVNGFACKATGEACQVLAALENTAFVYLQRGPARQERINTPAFFYQDHFQRPVQRIYEQAIKYWTDDSHESFSGDALKIPWNIKRVRADEVWQKEKVYGRGVIAAVNDNGIAAAPALARALWRNTGERLNGIDDDGNGYVDDLFGYNFRLNAHFALTPSGHGTACAGIIAARPLNKIRLATGIAPRARLMSLTGRGYLRAYEYALVNGADIVLLSFMFIRPDLGNYRGVYRLAHEHLTAAGVLSVGGAGNFGLGGRYPMPPGRQIATPKDIPCVITVAGITKNGTASAVSGRGPCSWTGIKFYDDFPFDHPLRKPDVTGCIGGYPVWWVLKSRNVKPLWKIVSEEIQLPVKNAKNNVPLRMALVQGPSGNSFSGPHAVGVAALMLSANPELNPWEIKTIIENTSRDLGLPGWDPVYGAGLIDALAAVRAAKKIIK